MQIEKVPIKKPAQETQMLILTSQLIPADIGKEASTTIHLQVATLGEHSHLQRTALVAIMVMVTRVVVAPTAVGGWTISPKPS